MLLFILFNIYVIIMVYVILEKWIIYKSYIRFLRLHKIYFTSKVNFWIQKYFLWIINLSNTLNIIKLKPLILWKILIFAINIVTQFWMPKRLVSFFDPKIIELSNHWDRSPCVACKKSWECCFVRLKSKQTRKLIWRNQENLKKFKMPGKIF